MIGRAIRHGLAAVLVLLAILFGRPALAHVVFRNMFELDESDPGQSLCAYLEDWASTAGAGALAADAQQVAARLKSQKADLPLLACLEWVGIVARYSLVTGQEWHTWVPGALVRAKSGQT